MDKGIRLNVNAKFTELLAERNASKDKDRNKKFRRDVMAWAMQEFDITVASAATHYNHALKLAQAANPASVEGLGRPEDKKGGRKRKVAAEAGHEYTTVEPATFVVKKKKDNTVVAEGLTLAQAQELCAAAKLAKKATLIWE
jgi:hypothetical protein